jgi:hypothetical protein
MIITEKFVYIHWPKTGGTFVTQVLDELIAKRGAAPPDPAINVDCALMRTSEKHDHVHQIPQPFRSKKILFTIRSPYDHLVSLYEFGWWKSHLNDTFDEAKMKKLFHRYPDISFVDYIQSIYNWTLLSNGCLDYLWGNKCVSTRVFERANVGLITMEFINYTFNEPDKLISNLPQFLDQGNYLNELPDNITFIRCEDLNRELAEFLLGAGYPRESLEFILHLGKVRPEGGQRDPASNWKDYYTCDLKAIVREKERFLFKMFPDYDV